MACTVMDNMAAARVRLLLLRESSTPEKVTVHAQDFVKNCHAHQWGEFMGSKKVYFYVSPGNMQT